MNFKWNPILLKVMGRKYTLLDTIEMKDNNIEFSDTVKVDKCNKLNDKVKETITAFMPKKNVRKYTKIASFPMEEERKYTKIASFPLEKAEKQNQKVINYDYSRSRIASM